MRPRRPARSAFVLAAILLPLLLAPDRAGAHQIQVGVGTQTIFSCEDALIRFRFNLGYSSTAGFEAMRNMDLDADKSLTEEEKKTFVEAMASVLVPQLALEVRDLDPETQKPVGEARGLGISVTKWEARSLLTGPIQPFPFDIWWDLEAPLGLPPGDYELRYRDGTFLNEVSQQLLWFPKLEQNIGRMEIAEPAFTDEGDAFKLQGRDVRLAITVRRPRGAVATKPEPAAAATTAASFTPPAPIKQPGEDEGEESQRLTRDFFNQELSGSVVFALLALATLYGMIHALKPGHGKTMVAAYLAGTRGTWMDALILGATVTIAHTGAIFLTFIGIIALKVPLGLSDNQMQNLAVLWFGGISGFIVFAMGFYLLVRRSAILMSGGDPSLDHFHFGHGHGRGHSHEHGHHEHDHEHHHHDHDHDHVHDHDHEHEHPAPRVGRWQLFTLGLAGGMIPCSTGINILIASLYTRKLELGFAVLCFFSLGLGLVITGVALALLLGRTALFDRARRPRWFRYVPVAAAFAVMLVGGIILADTLRQAGYISFNFSPGPR